MQKSTVVHIMPSERSRQLEIDSGVTENKYFYKRRRKYESGIVLPTKFLLNGNITDPLNLAALAKKDGETTPLNSPHQTPQHNKEVEVIFPANLTDPLNLNGEEDAGVNVISLGRKKRKKKRKRTDSETTVNGEEDKDSQKDPNSPVKSLHLNLSEPVASSSKSSEAEIVSPVIPQTRKITPDKSKFDRRQKYQRNKRYQHHNFRAKDARFVYGNYNRYYGYRNQQKWEPDIRLKSFKTSWFENKDVLDIGCNVGHVTLEIAKRFNPQKVIGIDIDPSLIESARKNIRHYITRDLSGKEEFPISLPLCHGPLGTVCPSTSATATATTSISSSSTSTSPATKATVCKSNENNANQHFPNNVFFVHCNYVLENDDLLQVQKPEYDCILCLSVTKWIHLNWGDSGLQRMFKRVFAQLRPGGVFILEAQPWCSYHKKKFLTEETLRNYASINFKPEQFNDYLLSKEVGFNTCQLVATPEHACKGFRRPIFVFTKT